MVAVVWIPVVVCYEIIVQAVNTNQQHTTHKESPQKGDQSVIKINKFLYYKTSCCQMLYKIEEHVLKHYLLIITKGKATFRRSQWPRGLKRRSAAARLLR